MDFMDTVQFDPETQFLDVNVIKKALLGSLGWDEDQLILPWL